MRASTIFFLTAAMSIATAAASLFSFYQSFGAVPVYLQSFKGIAKDVRSSTLLYSRSHVTFQLVQPGGATEFSYTPMFKRFYYFAENLKEGMPVELFIGPGGKGDIWGLALGAEVLMSPQEAREARKVNGWWGFALFAAFFGSAIWCVRTAQRIRKREAWHAAGEA